MNLVDSRILVTGASGRLGGQLLCELTGRGLRPIAQVRGSSDTTLIDQLGLEKRRADLRNRPEVIAMVEGVDAVIHTAALVDFRGDRPAQFTGINTIGALEVYNAARRAGVKRFVHVSTVAAVGAIPRGRQEVDVNAIDEDWEFNLGDLRIPYVSTKRAAEEELQRAATEGGPELVTVNPSIIIAAGQSTYGLVNVEKYLRGWLPDLPVRINVVDRRDVATGVVAALEKGRAGDRYILGGDTLTLRELVGLAAPYLARRPHLVRVPLRVVKWAAARWRWWAAVRGYSRISIYPDLARLADYDWAYSSAKAERELGYRHRPLADSFREMAAQTEYGNSDRFS